MYRRIERLIFVLLWTSGVALHGQEFKVFDRTVQVHGFVTQGIAYTNDNNWLTMNTSSGSAAMTDMGLNISSQVTDRIRVGGQVYNRNLGELGQYHPSLDWAFVDYRFKPWLSIRGGKVKTTRGLYNDTQDLDCLHTFALLPQSVYPTDLRDTTIAHLGGDLYGIVPLKRQLGAVSYTAYAGHRSDSIYSGYVYLLSQWQVYPRGISGLQYGGDLRWNAPLKGLLIGASRMNEEVTVKGTFLNLLNPSAGLLPYRISTKAVWTNQFYSHFSAGKLRVDAEYRRYVCDQPYIGTSQTADDMRGWYVAGAYRIARKLEVGSYYSRYSVTYVISGPLAAVVASQTDTSQPQNHIYDKVITARVDLNRFWNVKLEGHFMDGYGAGPYPNGFYPQVNATGFKPNTNALIAKTGFAF